MQIILSQKITGKHDARQSEAWDSFNERITRLIVE